MSPGCDAEGTAIADLPLDDHEWVTLVVRDGSAIQPEADMRLRADDRVPILTEPDRVPEVAGAFAATSASQGRPV